jgi:3-oxoacyl-[acyl-carrier protein] reductase
VAPLKRVDILETGAESFDRLMSINLRGPFFFTQMVVNYMMECEERKELKDGNKPCVIFITSVSAVASSPERAEYCISKAGLSMAAQVYADRLASTGISVYEIRPGVIYTDMTAGVKEKYDKKIAEGLIPEGRWGQPDDIAKAVVALAGGEIPYSTGAVIELSGGMNIRHL